MVVLSAKFTILISWSLISIPLILLSALMRLTSTSTTILHNSIDSRHPWRTHIGFKGSDRRPFILILESILVCATCEWICLDIRTYAKQKRWNQLWGYYRKVFIQFIWLINYDTNSIKNMYSKFILFLIDSDWCLPIVVTRPNVFGIWFKN